MMEVWKNSMTVLVAIVRVAILLETRWLLMIDEGYDEDQVWPWQ